MNEKWHFIGIGGCGMSGLAKVMAEQGHTVSGSDLVASIKTEKLEQLGIKIYTGHDRNNLDPQTDQVVVSTAIGKENPEWKRARELGIPVLHRSECLGRLTLEQKAISVAGAHGKTTTSSMLASILIDSGWEPTVVVGGYMEILQGNGTYGKGDYLVAEADESDGTLLNLHTSIPLITNIEDDHMEYFGTREKIDRIFYDFVKRRTGDGFSIINTDCSSARLLSSNIPGCVTYGFSEDAVIRGKNPRIVNQLNTMDVYEDENLLAAVSIYMPGYHNLQNALGAFACARKLGVPVKSIVESLLNFRGVGRRFQLIGTSDGITIVDDYAHHPTEIKALFAGARQLNPERLVAVFQPHRYTRTRQFLDDFAETMKRADLALVTDVYSAGEDPIKGADSACLVAAADDKKVRYTGSIEETVETLLPLLKEGDLVLTIGAGTITRAAPLILEGLDAHE